MKTLILRLKTDFKRQNIENKRYFEFNCFPSEKKTYKALGRKQCTMARII